MELYIGIDLHSNNCYFAAVDKAGKRIHDRKVSNNKDSILVLLEHYSSLGKIIQIGVESTYNWYWLVDLLMDQGYPIVLTNPSQIKQYNGIKITTDKSDAFFLAELSRLNILPQCWICPKEDRPVRDLLRHRMMLVQKRTSFKNSLSLKVARYSGEQLSSRKILLFDREMIKSYFPDRSSQIIVAEIMKNIHSLTASIIRLEKTALTILKKTPEYNFLTTVPGIGSILAMVILVETGNINRFKKCGNFSSYSRCVSSHRYSNGKKKGENNKYNGSKYLAWAFAEAAVTSKRYCEPAQRFFQRKESKASKVLAYSALAAKICKACYYIMKNLEEFDEEKLFH